MDKDRLKELVCPASILLTYLDVLDIDDLFYACMRTNLSTEEVLKTKCGTTFMTIHYLLSFINPVAKINNFHSNKAYSVEMQGVSINGNMVHRNNTGHCFILMNDGTNWLMIDSYIGERELSYKIIDPESINNMLSKIRDQFTNNLWLELTGCDTNADDDTTSKMNVLMFEYDYSCSNMNERFVEIIESAKKRLNQELIGIDDSYLSLLSPNLDITYANNYLDSLDSLSHRGNK